MRKQRPERKRFLMVFDGLDWFVRGVRTIEHDLSRDEKVYRCDVPVGGAMTREEAYKVLCELDSANAEPSAGRKQS
jgi:hypothetical protein